ncbi:conserved exported hypothetical protein [Hyella patelloides LEGE 07179]|uniref:PEP-CTERM protein-sorting domain-containing protein n=1 Tax=Hyella patelloides LEGE 07179 TaxID=945734 RepID=A0A563W463_9CYAN|nr:cistern family PEP-CTERM protein [Hyella patelloides]VEP18481.1 conserved exported hypothetical protein [Hyella patelloides LEGE 07179]
MKKKLSNLIKTVLLAFSFTVASSELSVSAITLTASDVDKTFDVDWRLTAGEEDNDGGTIAPIDLSAEANFTLTNFENDRITLEVALNNTTILSSGVTEAGITNFGFSVSSNATNVNFIDNPDNGFTEAIINGNGQQNFPGGFKQIDVCVFTNGCSGGSQGDALAAGNSDDFFLELFGDFSSGATLSSFPVKFQTTQGSFSFENQEIPEPGMIIALGLFTIGSLVITRHKKF